jgi:hypothetical protein
MDWAEVVLDGVVVESLDSTGAFQSGMATNFSVFLTTFLNEKK